MKRMTLAACCAMALSCLTVAVSAQSGMMDKDKTMKKGKSVTMTGCVAEGSGGNYMLTNAMKGDMKKDMKNDKNDKDDMKSMTYDLMGGQDMKPHVGHKVQVTGMMESSKMKSGKMDKDDMHKDAVGTSGEMHGAIDVKSMKMISTTCP